MNVKSLNVDLNTVEICWFLFLIHLTNKSVDNWYFFSNLSLVICTMLYCTIGISLFKFMVYRWYNPYIIKWNHSWVIFISCISVYNLYWMLVNLGLQRWRVITIFRLWQYNVLCTIIWLMLHHVTCHTKSTLCSEMTQVMEAADVQLTYCNVQSQVQCFWLSVLHVFIAPSVFITLNVYIMCLWIMWFDIYPQVYNDFIRSKWDTMETQEEKLGKFIVCFVM